MTRTSVDSGAAIVGQRRTLGQTTSSTLASVAARASNSAMRASTAASAVERRRREDSAEAARRSGRAPHPSRSSFASSLLRHRPRPPPFRLPVHGFSEMVENQRHWLSRSWLMMPGQRRRSVRPAETRIEFPGPRVWSNSQPSTTKPRRRGAAHLTRDPREPGSTRRRRVTRRISVRVCARSSRHAEDARLSRAAPVEPAMSWPG